MKIFDTVRRVTTFVLGVVIIVNALNNQEDPVAELVIGMVMVGILPVESLTFWRSGNESKTISQTSPPPPPS